MRFSEEYNENAYMVEWFEMYTKSVQEVKEFYCNGTYPYRSFSPQVVEFIFKLANELGIDNTVKFKSVELYDRYLSEYFMYKYKEVYTKQPRSEWQNVLKQCKKQSYLIVMSCIQLISKCTLKSSILKLNDIKEILKPTGHVYSTKEIVSSEIQVFQTVGYKLNEPSIFLIVEYFIDVIPIETTESVYSTCLRLTDFVYIYRQELYDRLHFQKTGHRANTYIEKLELLDIEYDKITTAAAVVVTTFYILNSSDEKNKELCEYLSVKCETSIDNLFTISSVFLSIINSI